MFRGAGLDLPGMQTAPVSAQGEGTGLTIESVERYAPEQIVRLLADNHSPTRQQIELVASALAPLPRDVVDRVVSKSFIVTNIPDQWAFTFFPVKSPHIKAVIFLGAHLWDQSFEFIQECLLHEIAHVELRHAIQTELTDPWDREVQEDEADDLLCRWLGRPSRGIRRRTDTADPPANT